MSTQISYSESLDTLTDRELDGFLAHWDFSPPPGTLLKMLKGSSLVILARDDKKLVVCGYVAALSDQVSCGYISALEVRPEYRGCGIGTTLLLRITDRLHVYGTYLSCAPSMIPFYESVGFRQVSGMTKRNAKLINES